MKFLCDEMLGRLARYLRAAGYDTALAHGGAADRDLLELARREHRQFLTCDRRIAQHKAAQGTTLILPRGDLEGIAAILAAQLGVDWVHAPFTRCLVDNAILVDANADVRAALPADVACGQARACPACRRVYWAGSHHRRMLLRLQRWAAARFENVGSGTDTRPSL